MYATFLLASLVFSIGFSFCHPTYASEAKNTESSAGRSPAASNPLYPKPVEEKKESAPAPALISFGAAFDTYYSYNFNRPAPVANTASGSIPTTNTNLRLYDAYHNQLTINLVELTVKRKSEEVSFLADLDFGTQADLNAATSVTGGYVVDQVSRHIGQAFVTYTPKAIPGLTFDLGKMASHLGLELIKSKDNWQYSRSSLFTYGGPLWHVGLHIGYDIVPNKLNIGAYLYNGSNNTVFDSNAGKTLGAQVKYTPVDSVSVTYNFIGGPEQTANNRNRRMVHEANAVYTPSSIVSFGTDVLFGTEKNAAVAAGERDATWAAATVSVKYQPFSRYYLSPRFELYKDYQGFTLSGNAQTLTGYTVTNGFNISDGLDLRLEVRQDRSSLYDRFRTDTGTSQKQTTATFAVMYSF